jgi:arylsulfatase A-like enzyme
MTRLEKEGIADNTLVFFLGDNGQCLFRSKQFLYDGGIHVPLLVRWPGKVQPGTVREDLISGIDVTAAILVAAGVQVPKNMHGRDFLAKDAKPREHIFAGRDRCDIATERMRCVRDARYKYIRNYLPGIPYMQSNPYKEKEYPTWNLVKQLHKEGKLTPVQALFASDHKPIEELFDLQTDPWEVKNLASDPAQQDRLVRMRKLLDEWIAEVGDKGEIMENPLDIYGSYFGKKA